MKAKNKAVQNSFALYMHLYFLSNTRSLVLSAMLTITLKAIDQREWIIMDANAYSSMQHILDVRYLARGYNLYWKNKTFLLSKQKKRSIEHLAKIRECKLFMRI